MGREWRGRGGDRGNGISLLCDPRPSHTVVLDLTLSCRLPGVKPGLRFKRSAHQRQQCSHSGHSPPASTPSRSLGRRPWENPRTLLAHWDSLYPTVAVEETEGSGVLENYLRLLDSLGSWQLKSKRKGYGVTCLPLTWVGHSWEWEELGPGSRPPLWITDQGAVKQAQSSMQSQPAGISMAHQHRH